MPDHTPDTADDDLLAFLPEDGGGTLAVDPAERLIVLTVDDDTAFQRSLQLSLAGYAYQGRPIRLLAANSAAEAARVMATVPDVALVVLDVVMETDDAGLRLVRSVREVMGNADVRIVLVTGQPGMASLEDALTALDISDYWLKTDLSAERLQGVLTSNLRTWEQIRALNLARKGLQAIVDASNSLARARGLQDFSIRTMQEVAKFLGVHPDGLLCAQEAEADDPASALVIGASGRLSATVNQTLRAIDDADIRALMIRALTERADVETAQARVLFFPGTGGGLHAATYIATGRVLTATETQLLRVFAANINSGLINVALTSRLDRLAYEDRLLQIPNENALLRALHGVLELPAPRDRALLLLSLDQYSESCLTLGIEQGDLLLKRMALRLRAAFPPPALVARLHGDTFAILGGSGRLLQRHIDALESADADGYPFPPFISLRTVRIDLDDHRGSAREALAMGQLLLSRAASSGSKDMLHYRPGMERETGLRFTLSRDIQRALQAEEIGIELQPQIDLGSLRVIGAEALARWTRADGSRVPPQEFIPMAEANGLIVPIGRRVVHAACQALVRLAEAGRDDLPVAINVSALQLAQRDFLAELVETVAHYRVPARLLEIEITETAAMRDHESNMDLLARLREAGFPIAIDDFGTGYSSLAYLKSMPATTLKVDRAFVAEIGSCSDPFIADTVIALGHRMNMKVLAEGIETEGQLQWLRERGCALGQGWLFGRPEPLPAFLLRLDAQA